MKILRKSFSSIFSVLFYSIHARFECHNETIAKTIIPSVDFLFLLDASGSMCPKIDAVKSGFQAFAKEIDKNNINARFAVATFGGTPKILLPFQPDYAAFEAAVGSVGCSAGGQEASFEAIRMVLPSRLTGIDMDLGCTSTFGGTTDRTKCNLKWNSTSSKVIVHVTDEDSDLPTNAAYRMRNQASESGCAGLYNSKGEPTNSNWMMEPLFKTRSLMFLTNSTNLYTYYRTQSNLTLEKSYQDEIDFTANLLSSSDVLLISLISKRPGTEHADFRTFVPVSAFNSEDSLYFKNNYVSKKLIADNVSMTTYQYGHPDFQSQTKKFYRV